MTSAAPRSHPGSAKVEAAIAAGVAWLARSQRADGEFEVVHSIDPTLETGCKPDPSIFPTAVIVQALAFVPEAGEVRRRALGFLAGEADRHGLWRHWARRNPLSPSLPPDLDDTACVSEALRTSGGAAPRNRRMILGNRARDGRFYTWFTPRLTWQCADRVRLTLSQIRRAPTLIMFFRATSARPDDIDAVVNANALFYLGDGEHAPPVLDWLEGIVREGTESRSDKWYDDPVVVRYFLSRTLRRFRPEMADEMVLRLAAAAGDPSLNPLQAAMTATCLMDWGRDPGRLIQRILDAQGSAGCWRPFALYHGGRARLTGGGFADPHPDTPRWGSSALTTAFCVQALSLWRARGLSMPVGAGAGPAGR